MRRIAILVAMIAACFGSGANAQSSPLIDPHDVANLNIRTGPQVLIEARNLLDTNENVRAADEYFKKKGFTMKVDGLTAIRFDRISTKESVMAVYIPYASGMDERSWLHLTIWVQSSKGTKVSAGSLNIEGKEPKVTENLAIDSGKIQPGKGKLEEWAKCLLTGCGPAAVSCALSDGLYLQCVALGCGASALFCGLAALF